MGWSSSRTEPGPGWRLDVTALQGTAASDRINCCDREDIHAARLLIEQKVVAEAAVRIDDKTIGALEASLAVQRDAIENSIKRSIAASAIRCW